MRDLSTYRRLAELELAGMPDGKPENLPALIVGLALCDDLGQLVIWPEGGAPECGFIGWIRGSADHVDLFRERRWDEIRRLPREELQGGSVLFVVETWTRVPRAAGVAAHELARLPGVERICAFVWGGKPKTRRWRERAVTQAAA